MGIIKSWGWIRSVSFQRSGRQEAKEEGGGQGKVPEGMGPGLTGQKGLGPLLRATGQRDCRGGWRVSPSFLTGQVRELLAEGWVCGTADPSFGGHRALPAVRSMPPRKCPHSSTTSSLSSSSPLRLLEVSGLGDGGNRSQPSLARPDRPPLLTPQKGTNASRCHPSWRPRPWSN